MTAVSSSSAGSNTAVSTTHVIPKIPDVVTWQAMSFLDHRDLCRFSSAIRGAQALRDKSDCRLERLIFARAPIFDRAHYQEYWTAGITDRFDADKIKVIDLRDFLKCYYGRNPKGPGLVKDNCLRPFVRPQTVEIDGRVVDFNNMILEKLAEKPAKGHAAKFANNQTQALIQHGMTPAGEAELVIHIIDSVGPGKPWSHESENPKKRGQVQELRDLNERTGFGCDEEPDLLTQNTAIFTHYVVTGKRPFGDGKEGSVENRPTVGRTRELVQIGNRTYHVCSGYMALGAGGGSAPAELGVNSSGFVYEYDGAGVQRKFVGHS